MSDELAIPTPRYLGQSPPIPRVLKQCIYETQSSKELQLVASTTSETGNRGGLCDTWSWWRA
ncbi:hypothetical protein RSAG8_11536, partial [Rhizoctonia solani AG-8 WAC10335]